MHYFLWVKNTTTKVPDKTTSVARTAMVAIMLALMAPSPPPLMDLQPSRRDPAEPSSRLMASGSNTQSRPTCSQIPLSVHMEATPSPPPDPSALRSAEVAFAVGAASGSEIVSMSAMGIFALRVALAIFPGQRRARVERDHTTFTPNALIRLWKLRLADGFALRRRKGFWDSLTLTFFRKDHPETGLALVTREASPER